VIAVALFRNLNLGHPGSPSGAELVAAFGGPRVARSFQTNGTVVFEAAEPKVAAAAAVASMRADGYAHSVVVRPMQEIRRAVAEAPPVDPQEGIYRAVLSFYDVEAIPAVETPMRSRNRLVEVRRLGQTDAHSVCWKPHRTAGDVTGYLERLLGVPVTTRTLTTLQRLIEATRAGLG